MAFVFLPSIWEAKEHYFLEPRLTERFGCFSFLGNRVKHILPVMKNNMEYGGKKLKCLDVEQFLCYICKVRISI